MTQQTHNDGTDEKEVNRNWSMDDPALVSDQVRADAKAARAPDPPFVGSTPEEGGDTTKDANMAGKGTGPLGTDLDLGSGNRQKQTGSATIGTPRADEGLETADTMNDLAKDDETELPTAA